MQKLGVTEKRQEACARISAMHMLKRMKSMYEPQPEDQPPVEWTLLKLLINSMDGPGPELEPESRYSWIRQLPWKSDFATLTTVLKENNIPLPWVMLRMKWIIGEKVMNRYRPENKTPFLWLRLLPWQSWQSDYATWNTFLKENGIKSANGFLLLMRRIIEAERKQLQCEKAIRARIRLEAAARPPSPQEWWEWGQSRREEIEAEEDEADREAEREVEREAKEIGEDLEELEEWEVELQAERVRDLDILVILHRFPRDALNRLRKWQDVEYHRQQFLKPENQAAREKEEAREGVSKAEEAANYPNKAKKEANPMQEYQIKRAQYWHWRLGIDKWDHWSFLELKNIHTKDGQPLFKDEDFKLDDIPVCQYCALLGRHDRAPHLPHQPPKQPVQQQTQTPQQPLQVQAENQAQQAPQTQQVMANQSDIQGHGPWPTPQPALQGFSHKDQLPPRQAQDQTQQPTQGRVRSLNQNQQTLPPWPAQHGFSHLPHQLQPLQAQNQAQQAMEMMLYQNRMQAQGLWPTPQLGPQGFPHFQPQMQPSTQQFHQRPHQCSRRQFHRSSRLQHRQHSRQQPPQQPSQQTFAQQAREIARFRNAYGHIGDGPQ
jgi:hypothetical protein